MTAAAGVGALYVKRGDLFVGAIVASAAVVFIWQFTAEAMPWPTVAIGTGAALVALAGVWLQLARRVGAEERQFLLAAAAAALCAQFIAMLAAGQTGAPSIAMLVGAQLVFLGATLGFATLDLPRLEGLTVVAVLPVIMQPT